MYLLLGSGAFLTLFALSMRKERRRFRNAVFLGLALSLLTLYALVLLDERGGGWSALVGWTVLLLPLAASLLLAVGLIANGITVVRREGRSLGHLLSLLAGVLIIGALALLGAALLAREVALTATAVAVALLLGYFAFLFTSFVLYGVLYGNFPTRQDAQSVIVLGSGLAGGERVTPLLAARLERGRTAFDALKPPDGEPVLVVSGGRGGDERISEARAMADYLRARGFPGDRLLLEDASRNTYENLELSRRLLDEKGFPGPSLVVTNNFHALRAALLSRRLGLKAQVLSAPTAAYYWPTAVMREFLAFLSLHRKANLAVCVAIVGAVALSAWATG
ncbi:YdcF family protein [Streptomyces polyrhachis]|uniref:YdcF family protein n=1 Tax=Streptomyces polyrhachis TaxID=1282885 RepID=A0ABW2GHW8_9ACTN